MQTINSIIKELENIPAEKLEDLYSIIHSLKTDEKKTGIKAQKIISYAGSFADMTVKDYKGFVGQTKKIREQLFDRKFDL